MAINLKVQNGTPLSDGKVLCLSCRAATSCRDQNGRSYIRCHVFERGVRGRIVECSSYQNKATPSLHDLYEMSWILRTDSKREQIGFKPYKDMDSSEKNKIGFDPYVD